MKRYIIWAASHMLYHCVLQMVVGRIHSGVWIILFVTTGS